MATKPGSAETQDESQRRREALDASVKLSQSASGLVESLESAGLSDMLSMARELSYQLVPVVRDRGGRYRLKRGEPGLLAQLVFGLGQETKSVEANTASTDRGTAATEANTVAAAAGASAVEANTVATEGLTQVLKGLGERINITINNDVSDDVTNDVIADVTNNSGADAADSDVSNDVIPEEGATMAEESIDWSGVTAENLKSNKKEIQNAVFAAFEVKTDYKAGDVTSIGTLVETNEALVSAMKWRQHRTLKVAGIALVGLAAGAGAMHLAHNQGWVGGASEDVDLDGVIPLQRNAG
jgi:VIT1/CCC1 family predicted Fe2+/Mn2+ transporter